MNWKFGVREAYKWFVGPFTERENAGQEAGLEEETKSLGGWTCLLEFWKEASAGDLRVFIVYMALRQRSPGENL